MSEFNHQPPPGDVFDRAAAAVRGQAIPAPPADLATAISAALSNRLQLAAATARRRRWIVRGMSIGGLAACLAAAVTWGGKPAAANELLAEALANQQKAKSFRAVVKAKLANPPAGMTPMPEQKLYGQGGKMRIETSDTVSVSDGKRLVMFDTKAKVARTADLPAEPSDMAKGVMAGVQKVIDAQDGKGAVQPVPAVAIGGVERPGFRVVGVSFAPGQTAEVTYYLDEQRKLPLRYEFVLDKPFKMTATTDYLAFDEELDPELFSLNIPAGYKREELKIPAAAPMKEPTAAPEQLAGSPKPEKTHPVNVLVEAADKVKEVKSGRVVRSVETGGKVALVEVIHFRPGQIRDELFGKSVTVFDLAAGRSLKLDTVARTATVADVTAADREGARKEREVLVNPLAFLATKPTVRVVRVADEAPGGVTVRVFDLSDTDFPGKPGRLWIDSVTGLPTRLRDEQMGPGVFFTFDRWDATLDDALFNLDPPAGYTLVEDKPAKK